MAPLQPMTITKNTPNVSQYLAGIVHLHAHCIVHDGTVASFLPPLSHQRMLEYWQNALNQTPVSRNIIVVTLPTSTRSANIPEPVFAADSEKQVPAPLIPVDGIDHEVVGFVCLVKASGETTPFRAEVSKLLISPNHRRKGIARALMKELERLAREEGRWSLMLDTTVGTPAADIYPKLGYTRMGVVNAYGISPVDGSYVDEVWFWKDLRQTAEL